MSRTATCFFALGICVAMASACGDDDGEGGGANGGSGGSGAQGASGGASGSGGGSSGTAGSDGGSSGTAGNAGTGGGTNAGAGGATAGTGGTAGNGSSGTAGTGPEEDAGTGDAGPDGSVEADASVPPDAGPSVPVDSGVNGDCVGFTTGVIEAQTGQDVVIARVIFNEDGETATAVLRVVTPFAFGGGDQVLCWGPSNSECAVVDDEVDGERVAGTEVSVVVGTEVDPISVEDGELLFAANTPENDPDVFGYVNWGDHVSEDVDDIGPLGSNEDLAVADGFWTDEDSIDLTGTENAFFGIGDTSVDTGFDACTADQL